MINDGSSFRIQLAFYIRVHSLHLFTDDLKGLTKTAWESITSNKNNNKKSKIYGTFNEEKEGTFMGWRGKWANEKSQVVSYGPM